VEAEIRIARLVEAFGKVRRGGLSRVGAAELLGLSERHFRRRYDAYKADGPLAMVMTPTPLCWPRSTWPA